MSNLKTIRFSHTAGDSVSGYRCSEPNDQSGEYVRADVGEALLAVVKELARVKRAGVSVNLMEAAIAAIAKAEPVRAK